MSDSLNCGHCGLRVIPAEYYTELQAKYEKAIKWLEWMSNATQYGDEYYRPAYSARDLLKELGENE